MADGRASGEDMLVVPPCGGASGDGVLPAILVSPPWVGRKRGKPVVITGLTCDDPVVIRWAEGERVVRTGSEAELWHERCAAEFGRKAPELLAAGTFADEVRALFFIHGAEEVALPLLARWAPEQLSDVRAWAVRAILSRYETRALDWVLTLVRRWPAAMAVHLLPVESPEVAVMMAGWHARTKVIRQVARRWFGRHPGAAARALVPAAVGELGPARTQALAALRVIAAAGHGDAVRAAAAGYGAAVADAVALAVAADPARMLPAAIPSLPEWAVLDQLPPVRLVGGGVLPGETVGHVITMLRAKARTRLAELAADRGLTADALADRLVSRLGLDSGDGPVLDYGRRSFRVGLDEQLVPYAKDGYGKRLRALPKPGVKDDPDLAPAAFQRFVALKKELRKMSAEQIGRLEQAMVTQREWSPADFRCLVEHPVLWHLARRLVWTRTSATGALLGAFRVAEDRTYADVADHAVHLGDDETVTVAHPAMLGAGLARWSELFADYETLQPFTQLGRVIFRIEPDEARSDAFTRFAARTTTTADLWALTRRGWRHGDDGTPHRLLEFPLAGDLRACAEIEPGVDYYRDTAGHPQRITQVRVMDDSWGRPGRPVRLGDLPPAMLSDLLFSVAEVWA